MGGYGSTRWNGERTHTTVERCHAITIRDIPKAALRDKTTGAHLRFSAEHQGQPIAYRVQLTTTPQANIGGRRWWFQCPTCERRCGKLYLPPGHSILGCRRCKQLVYASSKHSRHAPAIARTLERYLHRARRVIIVD